MASQVALPKNLSHSDFEKNLPPKSELATIRFCQQWTRKTSEVKSKNELVKITISGGVTKSYPIFDGGNMEEAVGLVRTLEGIIADMGLQKDLDDLKDLHKSKKEAMKQLGPEDVSKKTELADEIREISGQICDIGKKPFNLFEKMLGEELKPELRDIVEKECDRTEHVTLRGVRVGKARGRKLSSLKAVIIGFTGKFGPKNSYELQRRYMQNNLVLNMDRATAIQLITRVRQMNRMLPYLPSLRHQENCPDVIPMVTMFNEYELCTIILGALTVRIAKLYYAIHPEEHPVDVELLARQLEKIREEHASERARFLENARAAGLTAGGKRSAEDDALNRRIPRKRRNKNNKSGGDGTANDSEGRAAAGKGKRHCERCAKWAPRIQDTHNTESCGLWNEDGSKKARGNRNGKSRGGNPRYNNRIAREDGEVLEAAERLAKLKLKAKKYKKQAKAAKKKARRNRRSGGYASSSDSSSSSDSD